MISPPEATIPVRSVRERVFWLASTEVSYEITGSDFTLTAKRALTADALARTLELAVGILGAVPDFVWRNVGGLPPQ